jgi:drug/metabolite transporter (DMT)-like permease
MKEGGVSTIIAKVFFFAGLALMAVGLSFLLGAVGDTSKLSVFGALFFIAGGAFCAFYAVKLKKRSRYLFFASLFILTGLFLLLFAFQVFPFSFAQSWPLLAVFAGLSMIPAGWQRYAGMPGGLRRNSPKFIIPAAAFVVLGCGLLLFSFRLTPFSLKGFILRWWPLLILLAGLLLALLSVAGRKLGGSK